MVGLTGRLKFVSFLTICSARFNIKEILHLAHEVYLSGVSGSKQTAIICLFNINGLIFINERVFTRGTNLIFKYNLSQLSSLKFSYLYLLIFNNN